MLRTHPQSLRQETSGRLRGPLNSKFWIGIQHWMLSQTRPFQMKSPNADSLTNYNNIMPIQVINGSCCVFLWHLIISKNVFSGDYPGRAPSVATLSASSIVSSHPETESKLLPFADEHKNATIVKHARLLLRVELRKMEHNIWIGNTLKEPPDCRIP